MKDETMDSKLLEISERYLYAEDSMFKSEVIESFRDIPYLIKTIEKLKKDAMCGCGIRLAHNNMICPKIKGKENE